MLRVAYTPSIAMRDEGVRQFADAWYLAWNSHNLDAILEHYSEHVVFVSPFVVRLVGDPEGQMRGKAELRHYFARALAKFPDLCFEPLATIGGVDSIVLVYRSINNLVAAEMMRFDSHDKVVEIRCHYADDNNWHVLRAQLDTGMKNFLGG